MPGRIISGIIQAGSCNPLMVLDEIDKLGSDYRGDPSAALLEALDGEQNGTFRDHFLELPFDLSRVFFITTANTTSTIPRALLDRMEVIELASYTDEEKLQIAKQHLIPKQKKKHGLKGAQLRFTDGAIRQIISGYTRESGVRNLERELANVCRKAATGVAEGTYKGLSVRADNVAELLGPVKFKPDTLRLHDEIGLVRGLAYTSVGGEVLDVEASVVEGTGKVELTGNLLLPEGSRIGVAVLERVPGNDGIQYALVNNSSLSRDGAEAFNIVHEGEDRDLKRYAKGIVNPGESFVSFEPDHWIDWTARQGLCLPLGSGAAGP